MEVLEWYYNELRGYSTDSNFASYDLEVQMTKDWLEKIISRGYVKDTKIPFLQSLIPEISDMNKQEELKRFLERRTK